MSSTGEALSDAAAGAGEGRVFGDEAAQFALGAIVEDDVVAHHDEAGRPHRPADAIVVVSKYMRTRLHDAQPHLDPAYTC